MGGWTMPVFLRRQLVISESMNQSCWLKSSGRRSAVGGQGWRSVSEDHLGNAVAERVADIPRGGESSPVEVVEELSLGIGGAVAVIFHRDAADSRQNRRRCGEQ